MSRIWTQRHIEELIGLKKKGNKQFTRYNHIDNVRLTCGIDTNFNLPTSLNTSKPLLSVWDSTTNKFSFSTCGINGVECIYICWGYGIRNEDDGELGIMFVDVNNVNSLDNGVNLFYVNSNNIRNLQSWCLNNGDGYASYKANIIGYYRGDVEDLLNTTKTTLPDMDIVFYSEDPTTKVNFVENLFLPIKKYENEVLLFITCLPINDSTNDNFNRRMIERMKLNMNAFSIGYWAEIKSTYIVS